MAVVRTKLTPGQFASRGTPALLTPQRFQSWADKFRALRADGIEFGVPWGHFEECEPAAQQFLSSKFNAGYIRDLSVDADGQFNVVLDCPGLEQRPDGTLVGKAELPDGTKVETAIKEVSPGIWDKWTDGQGREHTDIVGHVALTMMPVVAGQAGFQALSTNRGITYFSTRVDNMADENNDVDKLKDDVESVSKDDDGSGEEDLDTLLTPQEETTSPETERLARVTALLAQGGCTLPPDTTPENFLERLEVAVGIMVQAQTAQKAAAAEKDKADEPPITEEACPSPGVMLSTERIKNDPVMQSLLRRELTNRRYGRAKRIEALKLRGLPVSEAEKLQSAKVFLSTIVSPTGEIVDDETDRLIAALERSLPTTEFAATFLSTVTHPNVGSLSNPAGDQTKVKVGNGSIVMTADEKRFFDERMAILNGQATS